jgi:hypothetical protein
MKAMLAAFGVLVLSAGAASAQSGSARSSTGPYGQAWAEIYRAKCWNHQLGRERVTGHPAATPQISVN